MDEYSCLDTRKSAHWFLPLGRRDEERVCLPTLFHFSCLLTYGLFRVKMHLWFSKGFFSGLSFIHRGLSAEEKYAKTPPKIPFSNFVPVSAP